MQDSFELCADAKINMRFCRKSVKLKFIRLKFNSICAEKGRFFLKQKRKY